MKKLSKLALFFTFTFAALFLAAILVGLLSSWIEFARFIPTEASPVQDINALAWNVLPAALYLSVLLALSYSARRNIFAPLAMLCIVISASALFVGTSIGINRIGPVETAFRPLSALHSGPGLILSRSENIWVLLRESNEIAGPRVVSIPGQPLIYQEVPLGPGNTILSLPPLPLAEAAPWFIRHLAADLSLNAAELRRRLDYSLFSFGMYVFSLILFLSSLRFIFGQGRWPGRWPLANLFIGALLFRGIIALEPFLNAGEMNALIHSFLPGELLPALIPPPLITPAIFVALAVFFIFYSMLVYIASPKRSEDD